VKKTQGTGSRDIPTISERERGRKVSRRREATGKGAASSRDQAQSGSWKTRGFDQRGGERGGFRFGVETQNIWRREKRAGAEICRKGSLGKRENAWLTAMVHWKGRSKCSECKGRKRSRAAPSIAKAFCKKGKRLRCRSGKGKKQGDRNRETGGAKDPCAVLSRERKR